MSAHTPGPWQTDDGVVYAVPDDEITMVEMEDGPRPLHTRMVAIVYGHHIGEADARVYTHDGNARLIAAAPEMLALLRDLVSHQRDVPAHACPGFDCSACARPDMEPTRALLARIDGAASQEDAPCSAS